MELRDQGRKPFPTPCPVIAQPAETQEPRALSPPQATPSSLGPVVLLGPRLCGISGGWAFCPLAVPTLESPFHLSAIPPPLQQLPGELLPSMGNQAFSSLSRPLPTTPE